jgi:hypothetical protein
VDQILRSRSRPSFSGAYGQDVHDTTAALPHHSRCNRLTPVESSIQVNGNGDRQISFGLSDPEYLSAAKIPELLTRTSTPVLQGHTFATSLSDQASNSPSSSASRAAGARQNHGLIIHVQSPAIAAGVHHARSNTGKSRANGKL